jgi:hypothetical protein
VYPNRTLAARLSEKVAVDELVETPYIRLGKPKQAAG